MSGVRLSKPWTDLSAPNIAALPAQLGVYQIADAEGRVLVIGYAGGRELFGLRSALERELERPGATSFRHELTHGYMTRWEELIMIHQADHGRLPDGNQDHLHPVGRLTIDGSAPPLDSPANGE